MKKKQAQALYFQSDLSQTEIARILNVNRKTVYLWVKDGNWQQVKAAARRMPTLLVEQYYTQLHEMNSNIAGREAGLRYPTKEEAEIIRKLTQTIRAIKIEHGVATHADVLANFMYYAGQQDPEFALKTHDYAMEYMRTNPMLKFQHYQAETDDKEVLEEEELAHEEGNNDEASTGHEAADPKTEQPTTIATTHEAKQEEKEAAMLQKWGIDEASQRHESGAKGWPKPAQPAAETYVPHVTYPFPDDPYVMRSNNITIVRYGSPRWGKRFSLFDYRP